jgi:hypothetical protein
MNKTLKVFVVLSFFALAMAEDTGNLKTEKKTTQVSKLGGFVEVDLNNYASTSMR